MPGRLIVLEGCDGCGKSTQLALLTEKLREQGGNVRTLSYPVYDSDSSALVRMYLSGKFGKDPSAVNAYAASSFYAVDRCADFLANWKADYDAGALFVSGRYTTSNAVHQGAKLAGDERAAYTDWLFDYEYRLLGLPKPDLVIFFGYSDGACDEEYRTSRRSKRYSRNGELFGKKPGKRTVCGRSLWLVCA